MKIAIASDHRGVELKKEIIDTFGSKYEFIDCSIENYESDDYPDYAFRVGKSVSSHYADLGVLICGTGIGMSIAANKVKGVRCALVHDKDEAKLAKEHNLANVIAFGMNNDKDVIMESLDVFLNTKAGDGENHLRRVKKIINYEIGEYNEL